MNLFGFITGASGKGKSLTALTIMSEIIKKLQAVGFAADHHITMTSSETKRIIRTAPEGTVILQDEVPRLSGSESITTINSFSNWMEQSRAQRPFILFCSPTIWNLPNLQFALKVIPAEYCQKDPSRLKQTLCLVGVPELRLNNQTDFRIIGYLKVQILPDGHPLKTEYFAEKLRNLEANKKYGGARAAGWDQHQIEEALEDIRDHISKNYQGKKVLQINLKYVKRIIKRLEIAAGSIKVEDDLADTIIRGIEKPQQKAHQEIENKQLKLIDKLIPEIDKLLPEKYKMGSLKEQFRKKKISAKYLNRARDRFQEYRDLRKKSVAENHSKMTKIHIIEGEEWGGLLEYLVGKLLSDANLMKIAQKEVAAKDETIQKYFRLWFLRHFLCLKPEEIHDKQPDIAIRSQGNYITKVRTFLQMGEVRTWFGAKMEEFFAEKLTSLATRSFRSGWRFVVQCKEHFDSRLSNQSMDLCLHAPDGQCCFTINSKVQSVDKHSLELTPETSYSKEWQVPLGALVLEILKDKTILRWASWLPAENPGPKLPKGRVSSVPSFQAVINSIKELLPGTLGNEEIS